MRISSRVRVFITEGSFSCFNKTIGRVGSGCWHSSGNIATKLKSSRRKCTCILKKNHCSVFIFENVISSLVRCDCPRNGAISSGNFEVRKLLTVDLVCAVLGLNYFQTVGIFKSLGICDSVCCVSKLCSFACCVSCQRSETFPPFRRHSVELGYPCKQTRHAR